MKFVKVSICAFVIAAIATTLLGNYTALAEWEGISYFEGDTSQVWPPDMFDGSNGEGRYSKKGSVMPSPNSYSYSESQRYARGAVGMEVLDSYPGANYKEKLFYFLRDKNLNGTPWEQAGSALIVHQMLGRDWGDGGRIIVSTSHDWVELENRLVHNSSLRMEFEYHSRSENTAGALTRFNRSGAYNRYDAFRYSLSAGTVPSIVFYDESTSPRTKVYAIEIWCANPLGYFSGLPEVESYNLTPSLTTANTDPVGTTPLDNTSVARGSRITASGKVDNSGSSAGSKNWYVTMLTYAPGTNPATKSQRDTTTNGSNLCAEFVSTTDCAVTPRTDTFGENATRTASRPEFIVTNGVSVGTQFCFVVSVRNPTAATDAPMWRHSAMNCVVVEREYVLEPTIESVMGGVPDGSVVEPGASGPIRYTVENGGTDPSVPTEWRLTFYEYRPGSGSIDKSGKESTNQPPCEAFPGTGQPLVRAQCTSNPPQGWTGTDIIFNPGGSNTQLRDTDVFTVPDGAAVGTKYCWVTSVRPPSASSGSTIWRHSAMHCIVVGKNPKVQVWGGDIRSGRGINTSISTVGGSTYGSWGEYGALSTRANSGFASGAGLSGGAASPVQSTWSRLTFANQSGTNNSVSPAVACTFGCYNLPALPLTLPTLAGQFTQGGNQLVLGSGPLSLNSQPIRDAANRPYTAYVGSDITLSDTTISAGRTMIVIASGTVTIQGNIVYEDASYSSISDIPQVVIRAPRINILGNAERVDAWLLAIGANGSGVLNTCADIPLTGNAGRLTAGLCDRQLTVNGPVLADTVHLRRTAGSDPSTRGEPAEIFNLRADAYLWGNAYSRRGANQVQTVYTKELAPRL